MAINNTILNPNYSTKNAFSTSPIKTTIGLTKASDSWKKALAGAKVEPSGGISFNNTPKAATSVSVPAPATSSGIGAYKGININPGTQEQILSQIRNIDAGGTGTLGTVSAPKTTMNTNIATPSVNTNKGIFPSVVDSLVKKGNESSKIVEQRQKDYLKSVEDLRKFKESVADTSAAIKMDPVSARVMQGREAALQQANAEKLAAYQAAVGQAQEGVTQAQTQQGLEQAALIAAGGLAGPAQVPFGTQFVNPLTGELIGGQGGEVGGNLNIDSIAQQVISGQLSPSQADSMLGNNLGLTGQLNQRILQLNPQFNRVNAEAQAEARASDINQTGTTGGMLQKAATNATQALTTLTNSYSKLSQLQKTQVPGFNLALNRLSGATGIGVSETQAYNTALNEARAAVSAVLSAAGNTPTFSDATAASILPDGAGPDQIAAAVHTIQELISQKVSSFTNTGFNTGGGTGSFDW